MDGWKKHVFNRDMHAVSELNERGLSLSSYFAFIAQTGNGPPGGLGGLRGFLAQGAVPGVLSVSQRRNNVRAAATAAARHVKLRFSFVLRRRVGYLVDRFRARCDSYCTQKTD